MGTSALYAFWFVSTPPSSGDLLVYFFTALLIAFAITFLAALVFIHIAGYFAGSRKFSMPTRRTPNLKMLISRGLSGFKPRAGQRSVCIAANAAVSALAILVISFPAVAERALTGAAALELLAGKAFQFKCADGMYGWGRFNHHGFVLAAYKFGSTEKEAPAQRAAAIVRANGNELCFKLKDFEIAGELCVPISEQSLGIYRAGSKDDGCEIKVKQEIAED